METQSLEGHVGSTSQTPKGVCLARPGLAKNCRHAGCGTKETASVETLLWRVLTKGPSPAHPRTNMHLGCLLLRPRHDGGGSPATSSVFGGGADV